MNENDPNHDRRPRLSDATWAALRRKIVWPTDEAATLAARENALIMAEPTETLADVTRQRDAFLAVVQAQDKWIESLRRWNKATAICLMVLGAFMLVTTLLRMFGYTT